MTKVNRVLLGVIAFLLAAVSFEFAVLMKGTALTVDYEADAEFPEAFAPRWYVPTALDYDKAKYSLHETDKCGHAVFFRLFETRNLDPNSAIDEGGCLLTIAVGAGRNDAVIYMLERGADPNLNNRLAVRFAAADGNLVALSLLQLYGGEVTAEDEETALARSAN